MSSSTPSSSSTPTNNPTTPTNASTNTIAAANLEFVREEDFVEYFIFPTPANTSTKEANINQEETHLEILLQKIKTQVDQIAKDYIWHKDEFNLTIRTEASECLREEENNQKQVALPLHLHGISHYGDNIQDEWFIVHLLYEITRANAGVVARVVDADGEFLVIEAADYLPKWANPDTCEQRVYIADGHLLLVQNSPSNSGKVLSISGALSKIAQNPTLYRVSNDIQQCINERLRDFTDEQLRRDAIHTQIAHLPIGVASILAKRPSLIAPACRAFCERDPIDMKACRAMRFFPPEDRVRTAVKFTRCLYAMVMHSSYVPDRRTGWNLAAATSPDEYKEDLLGVKIACGFEILASQAKSDGNDSAWRAYLKSLIAKGYFKDNLEGSAKYNQLLEDAKSYFNANRMRFRTRPVVGKEIVEMLHSLDPVDAEKLREDENSLPRSDSDSWLDISSEELDSMLTKKYGTKKLFSPAGDMNAKEFTSNITDFLDRQSEFDGIDDDIAPTVVSPRKTNIRKNTSMRKSVKEHPIVAPSPDQSSVSFDPDAFSTHVKNFLDFVIPEDNWESNSEMSDYEDEEDLEKNIEEMTNSEMHIESDIKAYMNQMDKELARTTIGKSFEKSSEKRPKSSTGEDDFDDIESFTPIDINVNTLKNMMDSYKSQVGGSGPASNLLNALGLGMEKNSAKDGDLTESAV